MEVWIGRDGERHGPYQEEQVKEWLRSGQLSPADLGWYDGLADWQALSVLFPLDKPQPAANPYAPPPLQAEPEPVTRFDYAGFWQRFSAWLIDIIILTVPSMIAMYLLGGLTAYQHMLDEAARNGNSFSALQAYAENPAIQHSQMASVLITYIYYVLFEASVWQATPGKLALRMRVTDVDGQRISLGRSALRNLVRVIGLVLSLIPFLCYLAVAWSPRRQGWHDLLAKTFVLNGSARQQTPPPAQGDDRRRFDT